MFCCMQRQKLISQLFSCSFFFHRSLSLSIVYSSTHSFIVIVSFFITMTPSSSQNAKKSTPKQRKATNHPFSILPSYVAPICKTSSISNNDILKAIDGRNGTKDGAFNCCKDKLHVILTPIVENLTDFYTTLGKIDRDSTHSSSPSSSFQPLCEIEFQLDTSNTMNGPKFNVTKSSLNWKSKHDLATMVVNVYKNIELAK